MVRRAQIHLPSARREDAHLVGQSIAESGLTERDIVVLTLHRGAQVIPTPKPGRVLEAHDRLLCFGRLEEMRDMIPDRRGRRRRVRPLPDDALTPNAEDETEA